MTDERWCDLVSIHSMVAELHVRRSLPLPTLVIEASTLQAARRGGVDDSRYTAAQMRPHQPTQTDRQGADDNAADIYIHIMHTGDATKSPSASVMQISRS